MMFFSPTLPTTPSTPCCNSTLPTESHSHSDNSHRVADGDENSSHSDFFEVLYLRPEGGANHRSRSFEDFPYDIPSDRTLNECIGDFGYDDEKPKKGNKGANRGVKKSETESPKIKLGNEPLTLVKEGGRSLTRHLKQDRTRPPVSPKIRKSSRNRNEMSRLIKDIRKDREKAERECEMALRLKRELNAFDAVLTKKAGKHEAYTVCAESIISTLTDRRNSISAKYGRRGTCSKAA